MNAKLYATSCLLLGVGCAADVRAGGEPAVSFAVQPKQVQIAIAGKPFATYVVGDTVIARPFFAHVHTPGGVPVTRNHPPIAGTDAVDHATMHPGIWLAFGDVSGADFWRNQGTVRHVAFTAKPRGGASGSLAVKNSYEAAGKVICDESCTISVHVLPGGHLLTLDSTFTGRGDFAFGDQEEMGLGVRVATPLTVKNGGQITSSAGAKDEKQVWGKQADWCSYSGAVAGRKAGVLVMPHPSNFRRSWFHARDYGLLVANPFGQRAFTKGEPSKIVVRQGDGLRLRFGVLVFDGAIDLSAAYRDYLKRVEEPPPDR